ARGQASRCFCVSTGYGNGLDGVKATQGFEMDAAHETGAEDCGSDWVHCGLHQSCALAKTFITLNPPGGAGALADHDAVEKVRSFGQTLFGRKQTVFVLDREHGIVAKHAKGGDKLGPPLGAVAVTAG